MNTYEYNLEDKNTCLFIDKEDNVYIYSIKTIYKIATPRILVYVVNKKSINNYKLFLYSMQEEIRISDNHISSDIKEKLRLLIRRNKEYIEKIYNMNIPNHITYYTGKNIYTIHDLDNNLEFDNLICYSDDYKYSLYTYDFIDKEYSLLFCIFSKTLLIEFNVSLEIPEITYRFPEGNSYEILIDEELCLLQDMIYTNWDKIIHIMSIIEKENVAEFNFDKQNYIKKYVYYHYSSIESEQYRIYKNENIGITISLVGGEIYNKRYIGFDIFNYIDRQLIAIVDLDFNILFGEGNLYDNSEIIDLFYNALVTNIDTIKKAFYNEFELKITTDQVIDIIRNFDNIRDLKRNLLPNPIYKKYRNTMIEAYKRIAEEEENI